jgi:hypothetical protein
VPKGQVDLRGNSCKALRRIALFQHCRTASIVEFKVQSIEGKTYLLRYDQDSDEWTLQRGFDGDELLHGPAAK